MELHSYDSLNLSDYILNGLDVLNDYIIRHEKHKIGCIIYEGFLKDTTQPVKIYKRPFTDCASSKRRFFALMQAFRKGIILADNIFLSYEKGSYYLYSVEPDFSKPHCRFVPLSKLLKENDLDYIKKQRLFQSLVLQIKDLHSLGETHLEICPKNIWVEDQLLVRLRPFKIDITGQNLTFGNEKMSQRGAGQNLIGKAKHSNNSKYWYIAPELLLKDPKVSSDENFPTETERSMSDNGACELHSNDFGSDMWSLGCIFAELFVTLTPIFQSVDAFDTVVRSFEILGIPPKEDVYYINEGLYHTLVEQCDKDQEAPLITEFVKNISKSEAQILTSLLFFNPNNRPTPNILLDLPFFKAYTPQKYHKKQASSLLRVLGGSENYLHSSIELMRKKKLQDNVSMSSLSRSSCSKQPDSRGPMGRHRASVGLSGTNRTLNSIPAIQMSSDWWNMDLGDTLKEGDSMLGKRSREGTMSSKPILSELVQHQESLKGLPYFEPMLGSRELHQKEGNNDNFQTSSDLEETGHFEFQSPPIYEKRSSHIAAEKVERQLKFQTEAKRTKGVEQLRGTSTGPMRQGPKPRYGENSFIMSQDPFMYKRTFSRNSDKFSCNSPPSHNRSQVEMNRSKSRKEEHEEQMEYLASQQKERRAFLQPKAKLSINIETIKGVRSNMKGSYCCRISLKNRNSQLQAKQQIDLYSCFAPNENRKVKLDFKGEAECEVESFLQMYNTESLEIQVFYRPTNELNTTQNTESEAEAEAVLYGICKVNLGLALPQLLSLLGNGVPIRARRDWYDLCHPRNASEVVGQLKLEIMVEFKGDLQKYRKKDIDSPLLPKKEIGRQQERYQSSHKDTRKNLMREIDFCAQVSSNIDQKIKSSLLNKSLYQTINEPKEKLLGYVRSEKKRIRNTSVFDIEADGDREILNQHRDYARKKNRMKDYSLQYLEN